jgi:hypothetical protein
MMGSVTLIASLGLIRTVLLAQVQAEIAVILARITDVTVIVFKV